MTRQMKRWLTTGLATAMLATPDFTSVDLPFGVAEASATGSALQEVEAERAYRDARRAFTRSQFERAIDLFRVFRDQFPDNQYTGDSYYYQAYALYRQQALREALRMIDTQLAIHPLSSTADEARDLELRIRNRLAERGDAVSAELALRQASGVLARSALARGEVGTLATEAALVQSALLSSVALRRVEVALDAAGYGGRALAQDRGQEGCEEEDVQHAALQALMQMDTNRAIPLLEKVLQRRDECSIPLRKQAIFVLSQHDPAAAEPIMIDIVRNDPEPEVQEAAVFWLSQVGSESAFTALADILATTDDPKLQETAIFALSQQQGGEAAEILMSYALDSSKPDRLREKAIFWISQHPDHADAPFLIDLYGRLDEERLKQSVFISLAQLDDAAAIDWMMDRALDPNEATELRKQALFWAGQHPSADLSRFAGLYERLVDREMKEQLIFLYAQRQEPDTVDRLIEIARVETDPEIRKRVIFWLGQTGDERAVEYLLELVADPPR